MFIAQVNDQKHKNLFHNEKTVFVHLKFVASLISNYSMYIHSENTCSEVDK